MNRKTFLITALLGTLTLTVAQESSTNRLIKFEGDYTGDVRNGPYTFRGTDADPVQATVSNLKITGTSAVLAAPSGTPMPQAQGKRTADFSGKVVVARGRLTAQGPGLTYSEASGSGVLKGPANMVFAPAKQGDDPVNVTAGSMSFDVDTNISVSQGNVKLVNGRQTANSDKLVFDEKKELAVLTGKAVNMVRQPAKKGENVLNITGTEARALTAEDKKLLLVTGKVKLVNGSITTTGDRLYFDDKKSIAYIVGSPAISRDSKNGTEVRGGTLEQRTDINRVRQLASGFKIPADQFKQQGER
ncbi:lipopolysaccharide export system protein LptA [Deinobacterium chartae]|uniref:Lipopolysaccharide export system protein LptA n=1 Tax=Deinobacterium chartae TaxID=521158 RepID=A0A841I2K6_9DEIO|nr:LptA/OstA family protein [Deinobacterium chartae]MBB6099296.1 lipopolysaccharide export system protein LptA [Deinobacterium chartae]